MSWDLRIPSLPEGLVAALEREINVHNLGYTRPTTIYCCLVPDYRDLYVGVFGNCNASYEWFIWIPPGLLRTSNCGYGCTGVALCDGLVEARAQKSAGDHDLVLAWMRE